MEERKKRINGIPRFAGWKQIQDHDAADIKEYYTTRFGWTVEDTEVSCGICSLFRLGERLVGGMLQLSAADEAVSIMWMPCITVSNLKEAIDKSTSLGAKLCRDITQVQDRGRLAIISNPQGATVGIWECAEIS